MREFELVVAAVGLLLVARSGHCRGAARPFPQIQDSAGILLKWPDGATGTVRPGPIEHPWLATPWDKPRLLHFFRGGGGCLSIREDGPAMYVRADRGRWRLAAVATDTPRGLDALRKALAQGDTGFTICSPGAGVGMLPDLPRDADLALAITDKEVPPPQALARLCSMHALSMPGCRELKDLSRIRDFRDLLALDLSGCGGLSDLAGIAHAESLESLSLWACPELTDLRPLAGLRSLRALNLCGCRSLRDLAPLAALNQLALLRLSGCAEVADIEGLRNLTRLRFLYLDRCPKLTDLGPLANLRDLCHLTLYESAAISDLAPLAKLTALKHLSFDRCPAVSDIGPLANLGNLESLFMSGCKGLRDLSPLAGLPKLKWITLNGCDRVTDLSPLRAAARRGARIEVGEALEEQLKRLRRP